MRVEAMAFLGAVGAVHPVAVQQPGPRFRQVAVPHLVGVLAQGEALHFPPAVGVEDAELDLVGVLGEKREVDALAVPGRAERVRAARPYRRHRRCGLDAALHRR